MSYSSYGLEGLSAQDCATLLEVCVPFRGFFFFWLTVLKPDNYYSDDTGAVANPSLLPSAFVEVMHEQEGLNATIPGAKTARAIAYQGELQAPASGNIEFGTYRSAGHTGQEAYYTSVMDPALDFLDQPQATITGNTTNHVSPIPVSQFSKLFRKLHAIFSN